MVQHNIAGSEAFEPRAHVLVRSIRRVRRPWHPAVKLCAIAFAIGVAAGLLDMLVGHPLFLVVAVVGWFGFALWPAA